jgi:hypothetical protein
MNKTVHEVDTEIELFRLREQLKQLESANNHLSDVLLHQWKMPTKEIRKIRHFTDGSLTTDRFVQVIDDDHKTKKIETDNKSPSTNVKSSPSSSSVKLTMYHVMVNGKLKEMPVYLPSYNELLYPKKTAVRLGSWLSYMGYTVKYTHESVKKAIPMIERYIDIVWIPDKVSKENRPRISIIDDYDHDHDHLVDIIGNGDENGDGKYSPIDNISSRDKDLPTESWYYCSDASWVIPGIKTWTTLPAAKEVLVLREKEINNDESLLALSRVRSPTRRRSLRSLHSLRSPRKRYRSSSTDDNVNDELYDNDEKKSAVQESSLGTLNNDTSTTVSPPTITSSLCWSSPWTPSPYQTESPHMMLYTPISAISPSTTTSTSSSVSFTPSRSSTSVASRSLSPSLSMTDLPIKPLPIEPRTMITCDNYHPSGILSRPEPVTWTSKHSMCAPLLLASISSPTTSRGYIGSTASTVSTTSTSLSSLSSLSQPRAAEVMPRSISVI